MSEKILQNTIEKLENFANWIELLAESRIRIDAFLNTKGTTEEGLNQDLKEERRLKKEFELEKQKKTLAETQRDKIAELAEVTVFMGINNFKWLGNNTKCRAPALYDDYKNQIDLVADIRSNTNAEIETESDINLVGFSIDVTTGSTTETDKANKLRSKIEEGKPLLLKYSEAEIKTNDGVKIIREINRALPTVVVYVDPKIVQDIEFFMVDDNADGLKSLMSDLRINVVKQILEQLREYHSKFKQKGMVKMEELYSKSISRLEETIVSLGINSQVNRSYAGAK